MAVQYTCDECGKKIPHGQATLRTSLFRTVAWCRTCWGIRMLEQLANRDAGRND